MKKGGLRTIKKKTVKGKRKGVHIDTRKYKNNDKLKGNIEGLLKEKDEFESYKKIAKKFENFFNKIVKYNENENISSEFDIYKLEIESKLDDIEKENGSILIHVKSIPDIYVQLKKDVSLPKNNNNNNMKNNNNTNNNNTNGIELIELYKNVLHSLRKIIENEYLNASVISEAEQLQIKIVISLLDKFIPDVKKNNVNNDDFLKAFGNLKF